MAAGTQSQRETKPEVGARERPRIAVCESCPGKSVFIESGNTDGWIASDTTLDVTQ